MTATAICLGSLVALSLCRVVIVWIETRPRCRVCGCIARSRLRAIMTGWAADDEYERWLCRDCACEQWRRFHV
jgi:hypothetical protein